MLVSWASISSTEFESLLSEIAIEIMENLLEQTPELDAQDEFTAWSLAQGVEIMDIAVHRFPGRGLGIIAEKDFKVCEVLSFLQCHSTDCELMFKILIHILNLAFHFWRISRSFNPSLEEVFSVCLGSEISIHLNNLIRHF